MYRHPTRLEIHHSEIMGLWLGVVEYTDGRSYVYSATERGELCRIVSEVYDTLTARDHQAVMRLAGRSVLATSGYYVPIAYNIDPYVS